MVRFLTSVLVAAAVGFLGGSWYFSSELIAGEVTAFPEDAEALALEEGIAAPPETFAVVSGGVGIEGWYFEGSEDCGLVFLHGYTSNRTGVLDRVADLSDLGCHVVAFDARGHGRSGGTFHTFGALEQRDTELMTRWLMMRADLDVSEIGLVGVSYGAAAAIETLDRLGAVAFVIADSPYSSVRDIATHQGVEQFGAWVGWFVDPALFLAEQRADFREQDAAPVRAVTRTTVPVLLLHEIGDDYIPFAQAEAIAAAGRSVTFVPIDGGGSHASMFDDDPVAYRAIIDDFLADIGWRSQSS